MKTVTICASASFYKQVIEVQDHLESVGIKVFIPATAKVMNESGDFNVEHYKTWFGDDTDYPKKAALMHGHFKEVEKGDVTLVLNYEKHSVENYIGGNVLMEMAIAFYLHKPIFVMNDIPEDSPFLEEILGMGSVPLSGNLQPLIDLCK